MTRAGWVGRALALVLVVGILLSAAGCGRQPQVAPANRELIASLRTALSARNREWLEANWQLIEKARAAGTMHDAEFTRFREIVETARRGEWAEAEEEVVKFGKGQKPIRGSSHNHSHKHEHE